MTHKMGLAKISLNSVNVYYKYVHYVNEGTTGYVRASKDVAVAASKIFSSVSSYKVPYNPTNGTTCYYVVKGSAQFATSSTAINKWNSFTATVGGGVCINYPITSNATYYYETWAYSQQDNKQTFTVNGSSIPAGTYLFECWGAKGLDFKNTNETYTSGVTYKGGNGGYVCGKLSLTSGDTFSLFIGNTSGYNGGGVPDRQHWGANAGGASDIRISTESAWDNAASLRTRILVAGGGGGASDRGGATSTTNYGGGRGGFAGGYIGGTGGRTNHTEPWGYGVNWGGTQIEGGVANWINTGSNGTKNNGAFGSAPNYTASQSAGGGGWYGGGSAIHSGGGGGSSFISGFTGCRAVDSNTGAVLSGNAMTISGITYTFDDAKMVDGRGWFCQDGDYSTVTRGDVVDADVTEDYVGQNNTPTPAGGFTAGYQETSGYIMISLCPILDD